MAGTAFARTKQGEIKCTWEGIEYVLTTEGRSDLPDKLVENLEGHSNVSTQKGKAEEPERPEKPKVK